MSALTDLAVAADPEQALALLGVTRAQVIAELEYRRKKKYERCLLEMAQAAKQGGERRILRGEGGGGQVEMMIHPVSYHYWGQRLGYECWDNPQFLREYLRDNEAARVKTINDRVTIVKTEDLKTATAAPAQRRGVVGKRGRWAA